MSRDQRYTITFDDTGKSSYPNYDIDLGLVEQRGERLGKF